MEDFGEMGPVSEIPGQDLAYGKGPGGPLVYIWLNNPRKLLKMNPEFCGGMGGANLKGFRKIGTGKMEVSARSIWVSGRTPCFRCFPEGKFL